MSDSRFVTFQATKPKLTLTTVLGLTPPVMAGGYGGWTVVPRAQRKSLTEWTGIDPLRILIPIVIGVRRGPKGDPVDGFVTGISAEPDRTTLERMAQPPSPGQPPPLLTVAGPVPHASAGPWVIEEIDWDPNPVYRGGALLRQIATVHLLQYVRDDKLADLSAAQTARLTATKSTTTQKKVYVVKAGDTLEKIAARELGDYKRWHEIKILNGIADPRRLVTGTKLRLP